MSKTIIFDGKAVIVPDDLALKLELVAQTSDKRDNELAQAIADTNERISNIDMGTGQGLLEQEIIDRKEGDRALGIRIDTTDGNVTDLGTRLDADMESIRSKIGGFTVQGTKTNSIARPSIVFDYPSYNTGALGGRLYFQVPGDPTYAVKMVEFNYQTVPSFYDENQIVIWENNWSKQYGGFPWRDTIITNTDTDTFYLEGMTTYYDSTGDLIIRGVVVMEAYDDWIGSMVNRGFKPKTVTIVIAKDLKSVKSMRFVGQMGRMEFSGNSLGYGTTCRIERVGNRCQILAFTTTSTNTTTGSWQSLNEKLLFGLRPNQAFEFGAAVLSTNNTVMYQFGATSLRTYQATNNSGKYFIAGDVSWITYDQYPPSSYASNTAWNNR